MNSSTQTSAVAMRRNDILSLVFAAVAGFALSQPSNVSAKGPATAPTAATIGEAVDEQSEDVIDALEAGHLEKAEKLSAGYHAQAAQLHALPAGAIPSAQLESFDRMLAAFSGAMRAKNSWEARHQANEMSGLTLGWRVFPTAGWKETARLDYTGRAIVILAQAPVPADAAHFAPLLQSASAGWAVIRKELPVSAHKLQASTDALFVRLEGAKDNPARLHAARELLEAVDEIEKALKHGA